MSTPAGTPALRWSDRWRALGWLLLAVIVVGSLVPLHQGKVVAGVDKVEHLVGYGLLMFWFAALNPRSSRTLLAVAFLVLGVALELAQGMTSWRRADPYDVVADAIGILLGWALAARIGPAVFARVERLLGRA